MQVECFFFLISMIQRKRCNDRLTSRHIGQRQTCAIPAISPRICAQKCVWTQTEATKRAHSFGTPFDRFIINSERDLRWITSSFECPAHKLTRCCRAWPRFDRFARRTRYDQLCRAWTRFRDQCSSAWAQLRLVKLKVKKVRSPLHGDGTHQCGRRKEEDD